MTVLPDTSIWVDYLRGSERGRPLGRLLEAGSVVVTGPVIAELLAGASSEDGERLWGVLSGLPWAELDHEAWRMACDLSGELRARGRMVALTDIEIGVAAVRAGAQLWSRDRDFDVIGQSLPKLRRYRPPKR